MGDGGGVGVDAHLFKSPFPETVGVVTVLAILYSGTLGQV